MVSGRCIELATVCLFVSFLAVNCESVNMPCTAFAARAINDSLHQPGTGQCRSLSSIPAQYPGSPIGTAPYNGSITSLCHGIKSVGPVCTWLPAGAPNASWPQGAYQDYSARSSYLYSLKYLPDASEKCFEAYREYMCLLVFPPCDQPNGQVAIRTSGSDAPVVNLCRCVCQKLESCNSEGNCEKWPTTNCSGAEVCRK